MSSPLRICGPRGGETAELRRLVPPDDLYGFASVSGNYNPMHLPGKDGDGDGKTDDVAPGMFVASWRCSGRCCPGRHAPPPEP